MNTRFIVGVLMVAAIMLIPSESIYAGTISAETSSSSVKLNWSATKCSGYDVSVGSKSIQTRGTNATVTGLASNTVYTVKVTPFTNKKVKQYYNSKTKKWVNKKPKKKFWKGKKARVRVVKKALTSMQKTIRTKEQTGSLVLTFKTDSGPVEIKGSLVCGKKKYSFTSDASGIAKVPTICYGEYDLTVEDPNGVYFLPGKISITVNKPSDERVIPVMEPPATLAVVVDSEKSVDSEIEVTTDDGKLVASCETTLQKGYNYPIETDVPVGEYIVTVETDGETEEKTVEIRSCGVLYSALFKVKEEE